MELDMFVNSCSGDGLLPVWYQAIAWSDDDFLPLGPVCITIRFFFNKMHLKVFSAKSYSFCSCYNVVNHIYDIWPYTYLNNAIYGVFIFSDNHFYKLSVKPLDQGQTLTSHVSHIQWRITNSALSPGVNDIQSTECHGYCKEPPSNDASNWNAVLGYRLLQTSHLLSEPLKQCSVQAIFIF